MHASEAFSFKSEWLSLFPHTHGTRAMQKKNCFDFLNERWSRFYISPSSFDVRSFQHAQLKNLCSGKKRQKAS